eukprot:TRINITY_DN18884_c1_g1_i2.p1 TRINITY_DN18884_c1_g1~~TRINITY_DN18884_c1_g1_i2.p1  ORF type:complete len:351 (+),score=89.70 TRINITY_DN18884_c1_g1_i2:62-1114(+)
MVMAGECLGGRVDSPAGDSGSEPQTGAQACDALARGPSGARSPTGAALQMRRQQEDELRRVRAEHSAEIAALREQHAAELARRERELRREHAAELSAVKQQLELARRKLGAVASIVNSTEHAEALPPPPAPPPAPPSRRSATTTTSAAVEEERARALEELREAEAKHAQGDCGPAHDAAAQPHNQGVVFNGTVRMWRSNKNYCWLRGPNGKTALLHNELLGGELKRLDYGTMVSALIEWDCTKKRYHCLVLLELRSPTGDTLDIQPPPQGAAPGGQRAGAPHVAAAAHDEQRGVLVGADAAAQGRRQQVAGTAANGHCRALAARPPSPALSRSSADSAAPRALSPATRPA